jgi:hypothetical protein
MRVCILELAELFTLADAALVTIPPSKSNADHDRYRTADITFVAPSESWDELSSMHLLMRWETEVLVDCLTMPSKNTDWSVSLGKLAVVDEDMAVDDNDWSMALGGGFGNLEFTPDQLQMMVQMNQVLERPEGL